MHLMYSSDDLSEKLCLASKLSEFIIANPHCKSKACISFQPVLSGSGDAETSYCMRKAQAAGLYAVTQHPPVNQHSRAWEAHPSLSCVSMITPVMCFLDTHTVRQNCPAMMSAME